MIVQVTEIENGRFTADLIELSGIPPIAESINNLQGKGAK